MNRVSFSVLVMIILGIFLAMSFDLSRHARMVPLVAAAIGISFVVLQCALDWRPQQGNQRQAAAPLVKVELNAVVWMLSLPLAIFLFGFVAGVPAYLLVSMRYQAALGWRPALAAALLAAVALLLVFDRLMNMSLYGGLLWQKIIQ